MPGARAKCWRSPGKRRSGWRRFWQLFSRYLAQQLFLLTAQEASLVTCHDWSEPSVSGREVDLRTNQGCPGGHITVRSSPSGPTALKIPTSLEKNALTSFTSLESPTLSMVLSGLLAVVLKNPRAFSAPNRRRMPQKNNSPVLSHFRANALCGRIRELTSRAEIVPSTPDFFLRHF